MSTQNRAKTIVHDAEAKKYKGYAVEREYLGHMGRRAPVQVWHATHAIVCKLGDDPHPRTQCRMKCREESENTLEKMVDQAEAEAEADDRDYLERAASQNRK